MFIKVQLISLAKKKKLRGCLKMSGENYHMFKLFFLNECCKHNLLSITTHSKKKYLLSDNQINSTAYE